MATYLPIHTFLVKPHPQYPTSKELPNVDTIICPMGMRVEEFVKSVDVVIFAETPYYNNLTELCKLHYKRIVCIPMQEWLPEDLSGWPSDVDLFICPNEYSYLQFKNKLPCAYFPWPVDTERFEYKERDTCRNFLFLNGHGGYQGRKGAEVIRQLLNLWPEIPLIIHSQSGDHFPLQRVKGDCEYSKELYAQGDILICPHSMDGLCLQPMEAMASGIPVILTDGKPWNELPALSYIKAGQSIRRVRRNVDWWTPSAVDLATLCKSWFNRPLTDKSESARAWAMERSWPKMAPALTKLIECGKAT